MNDHPAASSITPPGSGAKWISPHTLAERWGVHRETVLRLVRSGKLHAMRVNRRVYRIRETDAEQYLDGQRG